MDRVLIVEDSEDAAQLIGRALTAGPELTFVKTLADARSHLESHPTDLVLLDVDLPDGNGFQFCAELRTRPETAFLPIIFLTAHTSTPEKVMGLSLGAEDYIVKPFDPLELRARVINRLTKVRAGREQNEVLVRGSLRVDLAAQRAYADQMELGLTPLEFKLLVHLIKNEDRVLSREQLLNVAWGSTVHVMDRTVDKHIASLRAKLGTHASTIETVPQSGYRFSKRALS